MAVGTAVGAGAGVAVGTAVGAGAGVAVGMAVGAGAGVAVGMAVGAGARVAVGTAVGAGTGVAVGSGVGAGTEGGEAVTAAGSGVGAGAGSSPQAVTMAAMEAAIKSNTSVFTPAGNRQRFDSVSFARAMPSCLFCPMTWPPRARGARLRCEQCAIRKGLYTGHMVSSQLACPSFRPLLSGFHEGRQKQKPQMSVARACYRKQDDIPSRNRRKRREPLGQQG